MFPLFMFLSKHNPEIIALSHGMEESDVAINPIVKSLIESIGVAAREG